MKLSKISKGINKIQSICNKDFSSLPLKYRKEYINMFTCTNNKNNQTYYLIDNDYYNKLNRINIDLTLNEINYKRGNNKWTCRVVIAFLHNVFELAKLEKNTDLYKQLCKNIKIRFNVPENRINTQATLFLMNLKRNKDNFNINKYFSDLEIFLYEYRDSDKLYKAIEDDKLTDREKTIIKEYYIV